MDKAKRLPLLGSRLSTDEVRGLTALDGVSDEFLRSKIADIPIHRCHGISRSQLSAEYEVPKRRLFENGHEAHAPSKPRFVGKLFNLGYSAGTVVVGADLERRG